MRIYLILLTVAVITAIVTYFLHKIKLRWVKYIPALLLLLFGVLMILKARTETGAEMQDLAWVVVSIFSFAGAFGGAIMAIILDWMAHRR